MKASFIGSTAVIVVSAISLLGQLRYWPNLSDDSFFGGITMILGALAYRLAKQRRLGLSQDSAWRRAAEIVLLLLVFIPTVLEATVRDGIIHNPLASVVIPAGSLLAYLIVRYKNVEPRGGADIGLSKG
jgi:hypothetical protein